jgi:hypothetical protein
MNAEEAKTILREQKPGGTKEEFRELAEHMRQAIIAQTPTDARRAYYAKHSSVGERRRYRKMSFREVFSDFLDGWVDDDEWLVLASSVEMDRRAKAAGCTMVEWAWAQLPVHERKQ